MTTLYTRCWGHPLETRKRHFIDTHIHMKRTPNIPCNYDVAINQALETMGAFGVQMSLTMPPPHLGQSGCDDHIGLAQVAGHPSGRLAVIAGGASLNPMIHSGTATEDEITDTANAILASGGIGFGEIAALHFALRTDVNQKYEAERPDHPHFLRLADIAANNHVPIDWHMEAVPCVEFSGDVCGIPLPPELDLDRNPSFLTENLAAFERLLAHNRGARIAWAHAGWDNTGYRTFDLMRQLLQDHPNLYMNIKIAGLAEGSISEKPNLYRPLDDNNLLRPEWLDLIRSFPDRFTIGTDVKHLTDSLDSIERNLNRARTFLDQLPTDLALKVGCLNAIDIYNLAPPTVCIDIKPGSYPNSINLGSGGTVPVAIFSSTTFDATTVIPETVTLASAPVQLKGNGTPMSSFQDVNGDGLLDLVVHVSTEALQLTETDTEAILEGTTFGGRSVRGRDTIKVVP